MFAVRSRKGYDNDDDGSVNRQRGMPQEILGSHASPTIPASINNTTSNGPTAARDSVLVSRPVFVVRLLYLFYSPTLREFDAD